MNAAYRDNGRRTIMGRVGFPLLALCAAGAVVVGAYIRLGPVAGKAGRIYSAQGLGGYVGISRKPQSVGSPLKPLVEAYAAGRYADAESAAQQIIDRSTADVDPKTRHIALEARRIQAYSAARRQEFSLAQERFTQLQQEAYRTPDHGKQRAAIGETLPTLEEEGVFQHAVCTSALGDKPAAEGEYTAFMRDYPQSILIHAAVKRIARLHGGDLPRDAERTWKEAMHTQKAADEAERRAASLCGPECLAELLRRHANSANAGRIDVLTLADEAKTTGDGTSLAALQSTAARHGVKLRGVRLTAAGLKQQTQPILTLMLPGHYVLVETVTQDRVTFWDPDGAGQGRGARKQEPLQQWRQQWSEKALIAAPSH